MGKFANIEIKIKIYLKKQNKTNQQEIGFLKIVEQIMYFQDLDLLYHTTTTCCER